MIQMQMKIQEHTSLAPSVILTLISLCLAPILKKNIALMIRIRYVLCVH
ncbi:hypothetical protein V2J09_011918 [Rumex salicifolius]